MSTAKNGVPIGILWWMRFAYPLYFYFHTAVAQKYLLSLFQSFYKLDKMGLQFFEQFVIAVVQHDFTK